MEMSVVEEGRECAGKNCEGERELEINGSGPKYKHTHMQLMGHQSKQIEEKALNCCE